MWKLSTKIQRTKFLCQCEQNFVSGYCSTLTFHTVWNLLSTQHILYKKGWCRNAEKVNVYEVGQRTKFTFSEISMGCKRVLKFLPGTVNSHFEHLFFVRKSVFLSKIPPPPTLDIFVWGVHEVFPRERERSAGIDEKRTRKGKEERKASAR